jgi:hypothetical protein
MKLLNKIKVATLSHPEAEEQAFKKEGAQRLT